MKKLLLMMIAAFAFQAAPVVYADETPMPEPQSMGEELPQIAPVDEPETPPLSPSSPDDKQQ